MDFNELLRQLENSPHVRRMAMEIVLASEGLSIVASPSGPPRDGIQRNLLKCNSGEKERPRWKTQKGRKFYEWDAMHGHFEVYNKHGKHIEVVDSNGKRIGKAKKGRQINVH